MGKKNCLIRKILACVMAMAMMFSVAPTLGEGEITLSAEYVEMTRLGETVYLALMRGDEEVGPVSYESSNDKVAAVNHGVVMAMGNGSAVITASYAGREYVCTVKVTSDFAVEIPGERVISLNNGQTAALTAIVTLPTIFDTVDAVDWETSDASVASVDENGVVTAMSAGMCTITARSKTQKTTETRTMMGAYISTDAVSDSVTVVVGNEFNAEDYPELLGTYKAHYDWQGFTQDLKKNAPVWTEDQFQWIRALTTLELREDGTFRQQVLNAQRAGYGVDVSQPGGDTYEAQAAKYQKGYVYNRYSQSSAELSTETQKFHDIEGMEESGINNFAEVGVFAVLNGDLMLLYNGNMKNLGAAEGNEWLNHPYVPFNNMVAMSENMAMLLTKDGEQAHETAAVPEEAETQSEEATAAEGKTVVGTGSMTWHGDTVFTAIVNVTILDDRIIDVTLREGSVIDTGVSTFRLWNEGKDAYFAQYVGKTVQDILDLALTASANQDHFDGGKIEGAIDAVTGATASSTAIAMAVQNAVQKAQ